MLNFSHTPNWYHSTCKNTYLQLMQNTMILGSFRCMVSLRCEIGHILAFVSLLHLDHGLKHVRTFKTIQEIPTNILSVPGAKTPIICYNKCYN